MAGVISVLWDLRNPINVPPGLVRGHINMTAKVIYLER